MWSEEWESHWDLCIWRCCCSSERVDVLCCVVLCASLQIWDEDVDHLRVCILHSSSDSLMVRSLQMTMLIIWECCSVYFQLFVCISHFSSDSLMVRFLQMRIIICECCSVVCIFADLRWRCWSSESVVVVCWASESVVLCIFNSFYVFSHFFIWFTHGEIFADECWASGSVVLCIEW